MRSEKGKLAANCEMKAMERRVPRQAGDAIRRVFGGRVKFGEPLSGYTTMGVGGPADIFVDVESEGELGELLLICENNGLPILVLGRGSNLIVREGGWRGAVVRFTGGELCAIAVEGRRIAAGGGALLGDLVEEAVRSSLSGIELLAGIPGTVGGAVRMNAGARGQTLGEVVAEARLMDFAGTVRRVEGRLMGFSYRRCAALENAVLLSVRVELREGGRGEIRRRFLESLADHAERIPRALNAGCIFRNPEGTPPAGVLIESAGLKGAREGGAVVSGCHGNIIVNRGDATADDVLKLMRLIRERVREERGIDLEPEVMVVGEQSRWGDFSGVSDEQA